MKKTKSGKEISGKMEMGTLQFLKSFDKSTHGRVL